MDATVKELADDLFKRRYKKPRPGLCRSSAEVLLSQLLPVLIPTLGNTHDQTPDTLALKLSELLALTSQIIDCVQPKSSSKSKSEKIATAWFRTFKHIERQLDHDATFMSESDPAAFSPEEVMLAYPGFYAIATYRLAHELLRLNVKFLPRLFAEIAHSRTGIDIHPGASIGTPFHIDHGTGVVIGETAQIGKRVIIYQGVTLGALAVSRDVRGQKRHPTVEDNVIIYANSTILGGNTVIGKGAVIGGSVWLTQSVAAGARVFHQPSIKVK